MLALPNPLCSVAFVRNQMLTNRRFRTRDMTGECLCVVHETEDPIATLGAKEIIFSDNDN